MTIHQVALQWSPTSTFIKSGSGPTGQSCRALMFLYRVPTQVLQSLIKSYI